MITEYFSQQLFNQVVEIFMAAFCFSCTWALISLCSWNLWSALRNGLRQLQQLHKVPCNRCIFCTGDYHLKCTVHPISAFSEEAIDCPDFQIALHPISLPISPTKFVSPVSTTLLSKLSTDELS